MATVNDFVSDFTTAWEAIFTALSPLPNNFTTELDQLEIGINQYQLQATQIGFDSTDANQPLTLVSFRYLHYNLLTLLETDGNKAFFLFQLFIVELFKRSFWEGLASVVGVDFEETEVAIVRQQDIMSFEWNCEVTLTP